MKVEIVLDIVVKPGQNKTEITGKTEAGALKLNVAAPPVKGKANQELLKFFKKKYKLNAEIVSGKTSRKKKVRLFQD